MIIIFISSSFYGLGFYLHTSCHDHGIKTFFGQIIWSDFLSFLTCLFFSQSCFFSLSTTEHFLFISLFPVFLLTNIEYYHYSKFYDMII